MKPIIFREYNKMLHKPVSLTDKKCSSLPIFNGEGQCISKWKLSAMERIKIAFTGVVWLSVLSGDTQPPVSLSIHFPFSGEEATK